MTAVVAVSTCRWRPPERLVFALILCVFLIQNLLRRTEVRERMTGRNDSRYEQFEISPDTIEQELRHDNYDFTVG